METKSHKNIDRIGRLSWTARIIGTFFAVIFILIGLTEALWGTDPYTTESFILTCLVIFAAVGVIIAWKNAKNGGMLTLVAGIALSVFALFSAGHNHAFAMLISGGPYIIAGTLFLASCKKSK